MYWVINVLYNNALHHKFYLNCIWCIFVSSSNVFSFHFKHDKKTQNTYEVEGDFGVLPKNLRIYILNLYLFLDGSKSSILLLHSTALVDQTVFIQQSTVNWRFNSRGNFWLPRFAVITLSHQLNTRRLLNEHYYFIHYTQTWENFDYGFLSLLFQFETKYEMK